MPFQKILVATNSINPPRLKPRRQGNQSIQKTKRTAMRQSVQGIAEIRCHLAVIFAQPHNGMTSSNADFYKSRTVSSPSPG